MISEFLIQFVQQVIGTTNICLLLNETALLLTFPTFWLKKMQAHFGIAFHVILRIKTYFTEIAFICIYKFQSTDALMHTSRDNKILSKPSGV